MHSCRLNRQCSRRPLRSSPGSGEPRILRKPYVFDTSSVIHFHSSLHITHGCSCNFFPTHSLPWLFTTAAKGCLTGPPDRSLPRGLPSSQIQLFTAHHHSPYDSIVGGSIKRHYRLIHWGTSISKLGREDLLPSPFVSDRGKA